jgi:hypothetical protein
MISAPAKKEYNGPALLVAKRLVGEIFIPEREPEVYIFSLPEYISNAQLSQMVLDEWNNNADIQG